VRFELEAQGREGSGRAQSRRLRRQGRVPAIIYGADRAPTAITLDHDDLMHKMERRAFYTSILTLKVGGESNAVVVKDVQRHPSKRELLHLDFQRIVEDEAITLHVPIRFVGEQNARGVKEQGGAIEHTLTDVEISCLPRHLPEYLELDVTNLGLNEILHLSDIPLPEGVTSVALAHGQDQPVVAIHPPRREEVDLEVTAEPTAVAAAVPTEEAPPEAAAD